jgi:hypothetical protein
MLDPGKIGQSTIKCILHCLNGRAPPAAFDAGV